MPVDGFRLTVQEHRPDLDSAGQGAILCRLRNSFQAKELLHIDMNGSKVAFGAFHQFDKGGLEDVDFEILEL